MLGGKSWPRARPGTQPMGASPGLAEGAGLCLSQPLSVADSRAMSCLPSTQGVARARCLPPFFQLPEQWSLFPLRPVLPGMSQGVVGLTPGAA